MACLAAVGDLDDAAAEAARDTCWPPRGGMRSSRIRSKLTILRSGDPVHVFFLPVEARGDHAQRVAVIARRQLALILRAGQVEVLLEPTWRRRPCRPTVLRAPRQTRRRATGRGRSCSGSFLQGRRTVTADPGGIKMPPLRTGKKGTECGVPATLRLSSPTQLCKRPTRGLKLPWGRCGGVDEARGIAFRDRRSVAGRARSGPDLSRQRHRRHHPVVVRERGHGAADRRRPLRPLGQVSTASPACTGSTATSLRSIACGRRTSIPYAMPAVATRSTCAYPRLGPVVRALNFDCGSRLAIR